MPLAQHRETLELHAALRDALEVREEPPAIRMPYGDTARGHRFATQCLRARRLLQQGVPVVQLFTEQHPPVWRRDPFPANHPDVPSQQQLRQALAALHADLQRDALLKQTLVVICGYEVDRLAPSSDSIVLVDDPAEVAGQRDAFCAAVGQPPLGSVAAV